MKRFILICVVFAIAAAAHADIIVLRSGENIEDVKVTSLTSDGVTYQLNGKEKTIAASEIDGVLYDNGRYITPPSKSYEPASSEPENASSSNGAWDVNDASTTSNNGDWGVDDATPVNDKRAAKQQKRAASSSYTSSDQIDINIFGLSDKPKFDGIIVEYRVITKENVATNQYPEFELLGTTPFAHLTEAEYKIMTALNKKYADKMEIRPLWVDKGAKIEFRLSKEGYQTLVVSPMIKVDFGGRCIFLPLNKLKPIN